jgi:peroxiredoxin
MNYLLVIVIFILSLNIAKADWEADVRLTNSPDTSRVTGYNAWNIGASGDTLHVVFYDNRDGNYNIYYKRSTDGGDTWEEDVRLTNEETTSRTPCLAVEGDFVHTAWNDDRDGNREIYYKRSSDGGNTWSEDIRLTNDTNFSYQPAIALSVNIVLIGFTNIIGDIYSEDYQGDVLFVKSTDKGESWGGSEEIFADPVNSQYNPAVAADGKMAYYIYNDKDKKELYCRCSYDEGENWGEPNQLTDAPGWSQLSCVTVENHVIHLVWADTRKMVNEIYYSQSADSGKTWSQSMRLSYSDRHSWWPSIAVSGSNVYIVWQEERNGFEVYYTKSTDGGKTWNKEMLLSDNSGASSQRPSVCIAGTAVHVVWYDTRDHENAEIYYKRNPTGNLVSVLDEYDDGDDLHVYPNPAIDQIFIKNINPDLLPVRVDIYNSIGIPIYKEIVPGFEAGSGIITIPSLELSAGFYYLVIKGHGFKRTKKLLIIK